MIRVTIWNEFYHERTREEIKAVYPNGIHAAIAEAFEGNERFTVLTATQNEPGQGLPDEVLNNTDVLFWWGHAKHAEVDDALVERIAKRVRDGMGIIVLHSGHNSKIFKRLMATECRFKWWVDGDGDHERLFNVMPGHAITADLPETFELPHEETYCKYFSIPQPDELIFMGWFSGGGVLRSGCCWNHGSGKIFYFQPGHEEFPIYYDKNIRKVLVNAAAWAAPNGNAAMTYGHLEPFEK